MIDLSAALPIYPLELPMSRRFDPMEPFKSRLKGWWAEFEFNSEFWLTIILNEILK